MNVWIWGPPMWEIMHSSAFILDKHKLNSESLYKSLTILLPCRHCRESFNIFWEQTGPPERGHTARWVYEIHKLVNRKLHNQRVEKYIGSQNLPKKINRVLLQSAIDLFPEPSFEVVCKRYLVNNDESLAWTSVSTALLALCMGLEKNPGGLTEFYSFINILKIVVSLSEQKNKHFILNVLESLDGQSVQSSIYILEKLKYNKITDSKQKDLIRAGSCINGTCL